MKILLLLLLLLTLAAPLASAILAGLFALREKRLFLGWACSGLITLGAASSLALLALPGEDVIGLDLFEWFLGLHFGLAADPLSLVMMSVVGVVSACVHFYSIFYMAEDEGFNRFFAYLGLFVFAMMILVMSDNFLGLFVGWEGVGLSSWLLIGFWYQNDKFSHAANEAFVMNRIADVGFILGLFLLYIHTGSLNFASVFAALGGVDPAVLAGVGACLFIGAMGKSAQFPLHTWLGDAMAGPTPVSALIHAATMVTAGVYLLIRCAPLYELTPEVSLFVAGLGSFVALFAASMALVGRDLKRIIAFSTLSQLGYMFAAAGLGAPGLALFHLATHAFFKALLFLGAGNVMHAMHDELDISKMGGLARPLKFSAALMCLGSLALAGIYPFAGFFSKDLILGFAFNSFHHAIFTALLAAAGLTAFYSFRLLMLVFFTPPRHDSHPHEASALGLVAMLPLAILAVVAGLFEEGFFDFVGLDFSSGQNEMVMILATAAALLGLILALLAYARGYFGPGVEKNILHRLLRREYYLPELYERFITQRYARLAQVLLHCELFLIEGSLARLIAAVQRLGARLTVKSSLALMLYFLAAGAVALLGLAWLGGSVAGGLLG